jgi:hypothetical protein
MGKNLDARRSVSWDDQDSGPGKMLSHRPTGSPFDSILTQFSGPHHIVISTSRVKKSPDHALTCDPTYTSERRPRCCPESATIRAGFSFQHSTEVI